MRIISRFADCRPKTAKLILQSSLLCNGAAFISLTAADSEKTAIGRYSDFTANFKDGMSLSYSVNGPQVRMS